ncbi:transposase [Parvibaculum sedimenti]|uniref:transposase n=1 Tax=Parvibaculum sedimenti TaxID=2608632 RepID=UPI003BB51AE6
MTFFTALDYLGGTFISRLEQRHTRVEWLRFLDKIGRKMPKHLDMRLIADNWCTHKHQNVSRWLGQRPCFHIHLMPARSSWMNLPERFFTDVTRDMVREGSCCSIGASVTDIGACFTDHNEAPQPYRLKIKREHLCAKVKPQLTRRLVPAPGASALRSGSP